MLLILSRVPTLLHLDIAKTVEPRCKALREIFQLSGEVYEAMKRRVFQGLGVASWFRVVRHHLQGLD